ncbi:MAG: hypothetical protein U0230_22655 [Polyangiales bacterium]
MRRYCLAFLVTLLVASVADPTLAQQRRSHHRRRPRPAAATTEPAAPAEGEAAAPAEASSAPGAPTTPAAAPAQAGTAPAAAAAPAPTPAPTSATATAPAAAPATTPPEVPPPSTDFGDTAPLPDLAGARAEYEAIMNELVETRSRVAVLGEQLFDTQVRIRIVDRARLEQDLVTMRISLDGTAVFSAEPTGQREEARQVFEGFAAPGPHSLSLSIERRSRSDENFRVARDETFRFVVVRGKITEITILLNDRSDAAHAIEASGHGEFDVRTRVQIATLAREAR